MEAVRGGPGWHGMLLFGAGKDAASGCGLRGAAAEPRDARHTPISCLTWAQFAGTEGAEVQDRACAGGIHPVGTCGEGKRSRADRAD